jgi:hypothetical protein
MQCRKWQWLGGSVAVWQWQCYNGSVTMAVFTMAGWQWHSQHTDALCHSATVNMAQKIARIRTATQPLPLATFSSLVILPIVSKKNSQKKTPLQTLFFYYFHFSPPKKKKKKKKNC